MHSLLQFISRYGRTLLFLVLEAAALVMLFAFNDFHQSVAFTSASRFNGNIYEWRHRASDYFQLREKNRQLWQENARLEKRIAQLEANLQGIEIRDLKESLDFDFIFSRVIKNDVTHNANYLTIDAGSSEGVKKGMGVMSPEGIVGMVVSCSDHYALVASVLNVRNRFSCMTKNSHVVGSLSWDGLDSRYAWMEEMPGYLMWNEGDTVVTSGFSNSFPEGIPVGVIESVEKKNNDNFYRSKVRLFTRFETLSDVRIFYRLLDDEQQLLEKEARL